MRITWTTELQLCLLDIKRQNISISEHKIELKWKIWGKRNSNSQPLVRADKVLPLQYMYSCDNFQHYIVVIAAHRVRCTVYISLFNPELKFVSTISPLYELQIWWFFLLIFSKTTIFHLVSFVCMIIAIIGFFMACFLLPK